MAGGKDGEGEGPARVAEAVACEQALAQAEERARLLGEILGATPHLIYAYDQGGRYLYASPAAARALGLEPAAMVGRVWQELPVPAGVPEPFAVQREAVLASGRMQRGEASRPRTCRASSSAITGAGRPASATRPWAWGSTSRAGWWRSTAGGSGWRASWCRQYLLVQPARWTLSAWWVECLLSKQNAVGSSPTTRYGLGYPSGASAQSYAPRHAVGRFLSLRRVTQACAAVKCCVTEIR